VSNVDRKEMAAFPIDQRDIDEVKLCGGICGYCFNWENSDNVVKTGRS